MNRVTFREQFDLFWKFYPKRNGKKIGAYPCSLWFEAKRPTDEETLSMVKWLKTDTDNRKTTKSFYAELPDPIRFLKYKMWRDPIDTLGKPRDKFKRYCFCGKEATLSVSNKPFCGREHRIEKMGW